MPGLNIWFLDVGHGDCAYIELPNGARIMIDCGGGNENWPSKLLNYYDVNKTKGPVPLPSPSGKYGLDSLIITHPHGDHLSDIKAIHDDIGFCWLTGGYREIINDISDDKIDFKRRGKEAARKFKEIVNNYTSEYVPANDRVKLASPHCLVTTKRFLEYKEGIDLNEISWLVSIEYAGLKVLFAGDLTAAAVTKILASNRAKEFKDFVRGTSFLKVPHHGRENGCSQEMFDAFGANPLLCIASDESLNEKNQGTSNIDWYSKRTSDIKLRINSAIEGRKVLTTRNDKDIRLNISESGSVEIQTDCFSKIKATLI